jgi:Zn finger protein HypA/HybF involved in hydrogenase expression
MTEGIPMPIEYKLKTDPHGMVGRECPRKSCNAYFKVVEPKVYEDIGLTCPNCGTKANIKKYTTEDQVKYINSLIFHHDACPVEYNKYSKTPPCSDYVERPARLVFSCDACGQKFGYDAKPNYCPYCGSSREHRHEEGANNLKGHEA